MSLPLISVVIPVFNAKKFLQETLACLTEQTYKNIEIICINDGSTDGSLEFLFEKQKEIQNLIVYSQENKGVSAARNLGLSKAKGEFVLFLDSDDLIDSKTLETCRTILERDGVDAVLFNMMAWLPTGEKIVCFGSEHFKRDFYVTKAFDYPPAFNFTNAAPVIFLTSFLKKNNLQFEEGKIYEDWLFMSGFFLANPRVALLNKTFYTYRIQKNGSENITNKINESCLDIFYSYQETKKKIKYKFNNNDVMFINDRKILLESSGFLWNRLANNLEGDVGVRYMGEIRKIIRGFDPIYFQTLIQGLSDEVRITLELLSRNDIHSTREVLLNLRKEWLVASTLDFLRSIRNISKNLIVIILLYIKIFHLQIKRKKC